MNGSDLGANSYTYEISGLLATMYNTSGGMSIKNHTIPAPAATTTSPVPITNVPKPTTNAPRPTTVTPTATNAPESTTVAPEASHDRSQEKQVNGFRSFFDWLFGRAQRVRRRLSSCRTATATKKKVEENAKPPNAAPVVIAVNLTRSERRVMNWYNEMMTSNRGHSAENVADMERQVCKFQDQCLGGIADYTEEFKVLWGVQEPRCRTIVNAINSGKQKVLDPAWGDKMEAHFGCPHPVNETIVSDSAKQSM